MPETPLLSLPPPIAWPRSLDALAALVSRDLAAAPGAVVATCVCRGDGSYRIALGAAGRLAVNGPPVQPETLFDLASVTKPFLALTAARIHRRTPLLHRPLGELLAEARGTPSEGVPLELFLAHRAGLDSHRPLYAPLLRGEPLDRAAALREAALARRPGCEGDPPGEGFPPLYSDLGYLLVGEALARWEGSSLSTLYQREVIAFCGGALLDAQQIRAQSLVESTAPTEYVDFRGGVVRAEVHDENAWALGGQGTCGHAGLFGDAPSVVRLGVLLLEALAGRASDWLSPQDLIPLLRPRPGGTLRAGFDGKSEAGSSAGAFFSPKSFGHLGFTGTSLWIDPERQLVAALLSNRVHPTRIATVEAMKRARPLVHNAIARWADDQANDQASDQIVRS
ncbi:MAG: serine hydrolase domain-containing protein [Myxococcales bacterium]|nr:beta-lactamase family protein [Polyangiaceae bacterium]MDW8249126.1 serine hydrolase domain-containing protein [Myxococcales bacterium]